MPSSLLVLCTVHFITLEGWLLPGLCLLGMGRELFSCNFSVMHSRARARVVLVPGVMALRRWGCAWGLLACLSGAERHGESFSRSSRVIPSPTVQRVLQAAPCRAAELSAGQRDGFPCLWCWGVGLAPLNQLRVRGRLLCCRAWGSRLR